MKFIKLFKKKQEVGEKHHPLLDEDETDLQKCDLCENMEMKLKKCHHCDKRLLCKSCLETEKLCNKCNISYESFCQALINSKMNSELKKYQEL